MSLVGPRPQCDHEVAAYDDATGRRLLVKPGMTGLWQVSGRSDLAPEDGVRLDLYYVENWSVLLDLAILVGTAEQVTVRLLSTLARRRRSRGVVEAEAAEAATA
jgi:lipopolysaccharide/colanic/teichoic acid biosynthesis glycosyltransferase